ncbi:hypothetical protein LOD99_2762 [Oopsacas minuta]|uniref:Poly [ADP-ribose] polymerase n=1 Tax=Oopsacas minuta TaxID=111878 RepID=A0AAV7K0Z5_9METZ|nr:hypothetical protein LOD99_2762 [Oopsacas minuta]
MMSTLDSKQTISPLVTASNLIDPPEFIPSTNIPLIPSNNIHTDLSELESIFTAPPPLVQASDPTPLLLSSYRDEDSSSQFNNTFQSPQLLPDISLQSPIKSDVTPSAPSADLLLQFDELMVPTLPTSQTSSSSEFMSQPSDLNLDSEVQTNTDPTQTDSGVSGDSFGTPPSSPAWITNPPIQDIPPEETQVTNTSTNDPLIQSSSLNKVTLFDPLTSADNVTQLPEPPPKDIQQDIQSKSLPVPPPTGSSGSILSVHGITNSVTVEKLRLHFWMYRASIKFIEIKQDPEDPTIKMGVITFSSPQLATQLLREFSQLPLAGQIHSITADTCVIPDSLAHYPSPGVFSDSMDDLDNCSVMEGAPINRERKSRSLSPASREFSPDPGRRQDPNRIARESNCRNPTKFQRIEHEGDPKIHTVVIRNIPFSYPIDNIKSFVKKWWDDRIQSVIPSKDKLAGKASIMYINTYSTELPQIIVDKLLEGEFIVDPMDIYTRMNSNWTGHLEHPSGKRKRRSDSSQNNFYSQDPYPPRGQEMECNEDDYHPSAPPPPYYDPLSPSCSLLPPEEPTVLILHKVQGCVNRDSMTNYFYDFSNYTIEWKADPLPIDPHDKKNTTFSRVRVFFSNREAALDAMTYLAHVPLNGAYVIISLEEDYCQQQQCSSSPIKRTTPDDAFLIVTGFDECITTEYFEVNSVIRRYKDHYSEIRVQTNSKTGEKRIQIKFHNRDAIIEAEAAMLQVDFRGRKMDAMIEHIKQETPSSPVRSADLIIIVSNIPPCVTSAELKIMFDSYGNIMKEVDIRPMSQNQTLGQCNIQYQNSDSARLAIEAKDGITYEGHILEVKLLSHLIQTEPVTPVIPVTACTQAEVSCSPPQPTPPVENIKSGKMSKELIDYLKQKYESDIDKFRQLGGFKYTDGILYIKHPDAKVLDDFINNVIGETTELTKELQDSDLKTLLGSDDQNFPTTNIQKILGSLLETGHIDYITGCLPYFIHIFGNKKSVSVAMKNVMVFLYSQLDLSCPLDILFNKFPELLHSDTSIFNITNLKVHIRCPSLDVCKHVKQSMEIAVNRCCTVAVNMTQRYLKPAHIFITRNDIHVCLLVKTPDGNYLDKASKQIEGAKVYLCGYNEHVTSLVNVLETPCKKVMPISQSALEKLTRKRDKGAILLEKFESKSKVCIHLEKKNSLVISGFIEEDIEAMADELSKKLEDVRLTLDEKYLEVTQKHYLIEGAENNCSFVFEIIQELEIQLQIKVEFNNGQIELSGDQESILKVETNSKDFNDLIHSCLPVKTFHKVVVEVTSRRFAELIFKYLNYLCDRENYFIFQLLNPMPMSNRPGSCDVQVIVSAHPKTLTAVEPKIKEIRARSDNIKVTKEDFNLYKSATEKFKKIKETEFIEIIPDSGSSTLQFLSIGVSPKTAQELLDSGLSDQEERREVSITVTLAFYIREKKIIKELKEKFNCNLKLEEDRSCTCRIRMNGKRDDVAKVTEHIQSLTSMLISVPFEIKFPSKKFFAQFQSEVISIKDIIQNECRVLIDARPLSINGESKKECTMIIMSEIRADIDQAVTQFRDYITFDKITKPLTKIQQTKMVDNMLTVFAKQCSEHHYYIDLSHDNFSLMALRYFAKEAIPCGEKNLKPYFEFACAEYCVPNFPLLHSLFTDSATQRVNAIGINNSVKIFPPQSNTQAYKLEGNYDNVKLAYTELDEYVKGLSKFFTTCRVDVNCPIEALQADQDIIRFLEGLSRPDTSILVTLPSMLPTNQTLIASYEIPLITHNLILEIQKGDITKLNIDAIVNAANERLCHGGGVACAISNAGGPIVQQTSSQYVQEKGPLPVSLNIILPAGNIKCKSIIHAVGPVWDKNNPDKVKNELGHCVYNIFKTAEKESYSTIALPTISAGIFAFPVEVSTSTIIEAIEHFFKSKQFYSLQKIILIDIQDNILQQFKLVCDRQFKPQKQENIISSSLPNPTNIPLPPTPPAQTIFQFQENNQSWIPYSQPDNDILKKAYDNNPAGAISISRAKYTYTIDFNSMIQTNNQTQVKRNIQIVNPVPQDDDLVVPIPVDAPSSWTDITSKTIVFFGRKDRMDDVRQKFEGLVKSLMKKIEFRVTHSRRNDLISIMTACKSPYVKLSLETETDSFNVIVDGYYKDVKSTETEILAKLMVLIQKQSPNFEGPPNYWLAQGSDVSKLILLPHNLTEYQQVVSKFRSTLPQASIVRVERVQNTWLWTRYQQDKQRIMQKSTGGANEMIVYHGTRGNSPHLIYKGEQGFEARLAASGMWGTASYFAVNASYSNDYAYQCPDGNRQLFSVKICAGDVIEMEPDSSLRLPPLKSQINQQLQRNPSPFVLSTSDIYDTSLQPQIPQPTAPQFVNDRYDTVSGTTRGSKVYMIYENGRAYPEYLITYR